MSIGLRIEGFDVETADSADAALSLMASGAFDVAIVDLMMPGTNGIELARTLRDRHPKTCVVLMSAYHLSERQLLRADCGAAGFVPKPFDLTDLARFLRAKMQDPDDRGAFGEQGAAVAEGPAGGPRIRSIAGVVSPR